MVSVVLFWVDSYWTDYVGLCRKWWNGNTRVRFQGRCTLVDMTLTLRCFSVLQNCSKNMKKSYRFSFDTGFS